jgi:hypothetical protein
MLNISCAPRPVRPNQFTINIVIESYHVLQLNPQRAKKLPTLKMLDLPPYPSELPEHKPRTFTKRNHNSANTNAGSSASFGSSSSGARANTSANTNTRASYSGGSSSGLPGLSAIGQPQDRGPQMASSTSSSTSSSSRVSQSADYSATLLAGAAMRSRDRDVKVGPI